MHKTGEKRINLLKRYLTPGLISAADAIVYLENIDSTNLELQRRIATGAVDGTVIWAKKQQQGRGRLERSWSSSEKGIACSVLLTPPKWQEAAMYSFVTAVAVAEAIEQVTGLTPQLKWPNDLLIEKKKICGILLTLCGQRLVIGIGVNVNQDVQDFPAEIQEKATSLAIASGHEIEQEILLAEILNALQANHILLQEEGFAVIAEKWSSRCAILGQEVVVIGYQQKTITGIVKGLREDGALLLATDTGEQAIMSGDLSLRVSGKSYI